MHYFFNFTDIIFELWLCTYLEQKWVFILFWIVFLLSGFSGTLLSALWSPNDVTVGASGAVIGVAAAHIAQMLVLWAERRSARCCKLR